MDSINQYSGLLVACFALGAVLGLGLCWIGLRHQFAKQVASVNERLHSNMRESEVLREKNNILSKANEKLELRNNEWQLSFSDESNRRARAEEKNTRLPDLERKLEERERLIGQLQTQLSQGQSSIAEMTTQLTNERRMTEEKLALIKDSKNQLKSEFNELANKIFDDKGAQFSAQNKQSLDALLSPFKVQLSDFKQRVETVYDNESKDRAMLQQEIYLLKGLNQRISEDAINLTRALKGDNKVQGNWGEVILERVLEESGLQKGREYQVQGSFSSGEGRRLRPDVVVHLPEGKDVIVDSKVSLSAYESYSSAATEEVAKTALKNHVNSIRNHVINLSEKDYAGLEGVTSLDFVLMFVPVEAAFLKAMEEDSSLFSQAFKKNIVIVCPSTLLVTLRTIQNAWRTEYQNQNALDIAKKGGALYDQFVLFTEALMDVGDKLEKAQDAYGVALKRISTGRGNLVRRTEELQELGAKTKKKLANSLLANSESMTTEEVD